MGSCMNGDKKQSNLDFFKKDITLVDKTEIYQPLFTTLFNTFRKYNDLIVIFSDPLKAKHFSGVSLDDVKTLPPKSLKMTYSFKKVVIVGDFNKIQPAVVQITKSANVNSIHVIFQKQFDKFQKSYSLFNTLPELSQIATSKIPIHVFSSEELVKPFPKPLQIFIHLAQQKDTKVYSKLKIDSSGIIEPPSGQLDNEKEVKYYLQKIKGSRAQRICLLHNKSFSQANLMQVLSSYLMQVYDSSEISTKQYLSKSLPNVVIINPAQLVNRQQIATQKLLQQASNTKAQGSSTTDEFHRLFKQHINSGNAEKSERAYNLLGKLLANIISNPENQQYRKVKGMNKQMEELLTRSGSGIKLLRLVGFNQNGGFWVNQLEAKYLKVLRTDMDLGYRKAANAQ